MGKVSTTTRALFSQFKVRREYFALQSASSGRQYSGGGVAWGCRGQEIRIRVINNFCSVINPTRSISALSCHFYVLRAPLCWLLLIPNVHFLVRECSINHFQSILDVK